MPRARIGYTERRPGRRRARQKAACAAATDLAGAAVILGVQDQAALAGKAALLARRAAAVLADASLQVLRQKHAGLEPARSEPRRNLIGPIDAPLDAKQHAALGDPQQLRQFGHGGGVPLDLFPIDFGRGRSLRYELQRGFHFLLRGLPSSRSTIW